MPPHRPGVAAPIRHKTAIRHTIKALTCGVAAWRTWRIPRKREDEGVTALARPKMLKLPEVLEEIEMSRAAFYRMRARGMAPKLIKLPNGQLRCRRADLDAWWSWMEDAAA